MFGCVLTVICGVLWSWDSDLRYSNIDNCGLPGVICGNFQSSRTDLRCLAVFCLCIAVFCGLGIVICGLPTLICGLLGVICGDLR